MQRFMDKEHYQEGLEYMKNLMATTKLPSERAAALEYMGAFLLKLRQYAKIDVLIENTLAQYPKDCHIALAVAKLYLKLAQEAPFSSVKDGKYTHQGYQYKGDKMLSVHRDRIRALQLVDFARLGAIESKDVELQVTAQALMAEILPLVGAAHEVTDWKSLPDSDSMSERFGGGRPLNADGNIIFYSTPEDFTKAKNNAERLLYLLRDNAKTISSQQGQAQLALAGLLKDWYGMSRPLGVYGTELKLKDNEVLLPVGKKGAEIAVTLPEDQQYVPILKTILASNASSRVKYQAGRALLFDYFCRGEYSKMQGTFDQLFALKLLKDEKESLEQLHHKVYAPQAEFLSDYRPWILNIKELMVTLPIRYRNVDKAQLKVMPISLERYMEKASSMLKKDQAAGSEFAYGFLDILKSDPKSYLLPAIIDQEQILDSSKEHRDSVAQLKFPVDKAGVYLVELKLKGNPEPIYRIMSVSNFMIVQHTTVKGSFSYVADACSGMPVQDAQYQAILSFSDKDDHRVKVYEGKTNAQGVAMLPLTENNSWQIMLVRKGDKLGFMGCSRIAYIPSKYEMNDDPFVSENEGVNREMKIFGVNSQPAYRPGQTVNFTIWCGNPQYGADRPLVMAKRPLKMSIIGPRYQKIVDGLKVETDAYGAIRYELSLAKDAALGQYRVVLLFPRKNSDRLYHQESHSFLVEEYKKPEFELSLETPQESIRLGQPFSVTLAAKYYSGGPVSGATAELELRSKKYVLPPWSDDPWQWLYKSSSIRSYAREDLVWRKTVPLDASGKAMVDIENAVDPDADGDVNRQYTLTAEVTDSSKRMIRAESKILVSAKPFDVFVALDCGYTRVNHPVNAKFHAQTIQGNPILNAEGEAVLFLKTYNEASKVWDEQEVQRFNVATDNQGTAVLNFSCAKGGQYRLACCLKDAKGEKSEVSKDFMVDASGITLPPVQNSLELIADKQIYQRGDLAKILVRTNCVHRNAVWFFVKPSTAQEERRLMLLDGQTAVADVPILTKDMPNLGIAAFSVWNGLIAQSSIQLKIPPISQCLKVDMKASQSEYKPQDQGNVVLLVKDAQGQPVRKAQVALTIYDKSLDYIGLPYGSIEAAFWGWENRVKDLDENLVNSRSGMDFYSGGYEEFMLAGQLDGWAQVLYDERYAMGGDEPFGSAESLSNGVRMRGQGLAAGGIRREAGDGYYQSFYDASRGAKPASVCVSSPMVDEDTWGAGDSEVVTPVAIRSNFMDKIKWCGALETDEEGRVEVPFSMAENLTTWVARAWVLDKQLQVASAQVEFVCTKDFLLRLQAPRFFVEKDEVVLSAIVQNKTKVAQKSKVKLELSGNSLQIVGNAEQVVDVPAGSEVVVNWKTKAVAAGEVDVTMSAVGSTDSDAMKMSFPVLVHGMRQLDAWSLTLNPDKEQGSISVNVPAERNPQEAVLEVRVSSSLALSMLEALPFLHEYPHGCAEQTLNRFIPALFLSNVLKQMELRLPEETTASLNSQEMQVSVDASKRGKNPQLIDKIRAHNLDQAVETGMTQLSGMQQPAGGWSWFAGDRGAGDPYITAQIVHGLFVGKQMKSDMFTKGSQWLQQYERDRIEHLTSKENLEKKSPEATNETDAYIRAVLSEMGLKSEKMQALLLKDQKNFSLYGKILLAQELYWQKNKKALKQLFPVITQFIEEDKENQTAWLKRDQACRYWFWYNNDIEAQAALLKLMTILEPQSQRTSRLAKWLLNNRKNGSYWASTRDTAASIEALGLYLLATKEGMEPQTYELWIDHKLVKSFEFTKENLFTAEGSYILRGDAIRTGEHQIEFRRIKGKGTLYANAALSFFSLEDPLRAAGSDLKVARTYYKLTTHIKDKEIRNADNKLQVVQESVVERSPLKSGDTVKSGDIIEVVLSIDSKNDMEYLYLNDPKPAGCEFDAQRSGYVYDSVGAYREVGDQGMRYYMSSLPQGTHAFRYEMRAERTGKFSAMPTVIEAMYSPALRGNAEESKLQIID